MWFGLAEFRRGFRCAASFAVTLLAVLTLVASGAFHELDHADERGRPEATQTAPTTAAISPAVHAVNAALGKGGQRHPAPLHGCSGHCAAHVADQAPILISLPAPHAQQPAWRIDRGASLSRHPSFGPERPPRA
jgi:hypothetical protein